MYLLYRILELCSDEEKAEDLEESDCISNTESSLPLTAITVNCGIARYIVPKNTYGTGGPLNQVTMENKSVQGNVGLEIAISGIRLFP